MRVILLHSKNKGFYVPYKHGVRYDYNAAWGNATKRTKRRKWVLRGLVSVLAFAAGGYLVTNLPSIDNSVSTDAVDVAIELPGSGETSSSAISSSNQSRSGEALVKKRLPFEPQVPLANKSEQQASQSVVENETVIEATRIEDVWRNLVVAPGDNLSLMFSREELSKKDLHAILQLGGVAKNLTRIKPNQIVRVRADDKGRILELIHEVDLLSSLHVNFDGDNYSAELVEIEPQIRSRTSVATIEHSLYLAGQQANLSDRTIMALTDIFGWDIDFVLDIRQGDRFSLIFEEIYKDNEKVREGKILAAEFHFPLPYSSKAVSNAVPRLSPGLSHPTDLTTYARFTPSNSD